MFMQKKNPILPQKLIIIVLDLQETDIIHTIRHFINLNKTCLFLTQASAIH